MYFHRLALSLPPAASSIAAPSRGSRLGTVATEIYPSPPTLGAALPRHTQSRPARPAPRCESACNVGEGRRGAIYFYSYLKHPFGPFGPFGASGCLGDRAGREGPRVSRNTTRGKSAAFTFSLYELSKHPEPRFTGMMTEARGVEWDGVV